MSGSYVLLPGEPKWPIHALTWSIATENYGNEYYLNSPSPFTAFWTPAQYSYARTVAMTGFAPWADVCNLSFTEVPDAADVHIRFGFAKQLSGAWMAYRQTNGVMIQALIQFGESWLLYIKPESMYSMCKQACHEIGHSLGFDHSAAYPTIMGPANSGLILGASDIAGARDLYGPAQPTNISAGLAAVTGCQNDSVNLTGPGDHIVVAGAGQDQVATGAGHDHVVAGEGYDYVTTGAGNDTVLGGPGFDQLNAGEGEDSVSGGGESDQIAAGPGADTIDGGAAPDWVHGGAGADTFVLVKGEIAGDVIADFTKGEDAISFSEPPAALINNGNGTWTVRWQDKTEETFTANL